MFSQLSLTIGIASCNLRYLRENWKADGTGSATNVDLKEGRKLLWWSGNGEKGRYK